jgi:protein-L-isoaspartate(D-aspartate) O-methyltransferase
MNLELARKQMIEQQVRAWDVLDERVLGTLAQVRRELFVPSAYRELAFADTAIPLGQGQYMLPPKLEGRILQALEIDPSHEVLEVGTGSGFFAACLARLAERVHSIEIFPELAARAGENLRAAGIGGVTIETADAMTLAAGPRYDAVVVTGSLPLYDARFERALKVGGRLFIVVGTAPAMEALLVRRLSMKEGATPKTVAGSDEWVRESLFETVIEPLIHAPAPPRFVF